MKFKRVAKTKLSDVRKAHNEYGANGVRWGENNMATQSALQRYWNLRTKWESENPGQSYRP